MALFPLINMTENLSAPSLSYTSSIIGLGFSQRFVFLSGFVCLQIKKQLDSYSARDIVFCKNFQLD
jgi:hypothetical protein